jgi:hypothetical protein
LLLLEAKLILVAISPTIATMKPHKLRFRLGLGLLTWFLLTRLLTHFSSLAFSLSVPKNTFPEVLTNLIVFWKSLVCGGNMGGAGVVSSSFFQLTLKRNSVSMHLINFPMQNRARSAST